MLARETAAANLADAGGGRGGFFTFLALLSAVVTLQTCIPWSDAAIVRGVPIDQELMAALGDTSLMMNDATSNIVRVGFDMLFSVDFWQAITRKQTSVLHSSGRKRRKAIQNQILRWPNAEVPYVNNTDFGAADRAALDQAFEDYRKYTCLHFRPKEANDSNYVKIDNGLGCASFVGRVGGEQLLFLPALCRKKHIIIHELGHAIGLIHEHARYDRDEYIIVKQENTLPAYYKDFDKINYDGANSGDVPYDYRSIMHYSGKAGSANGQSVIQTRNQSYQNIIGTRTSLSFRDVKLINAMYRCSEKMGCRKKVCPGEGYVGKDCQCWCPSGSDDISAAHCPECLDYHRFCQQFLQRGFCTKRLFTNFMKDMCPRSCGLCK